MNKRFEFLDISRGLAALAVVLFHRGTPIGTPHPLDWIIQYGEVGANIFFVISGYVIYQSIASHSKRINGTNIFAKKRFLRIYPTFWISVVCAVFFFGITGKYSTTLQGIIGTITLTYPYFDVNAPQVVYWTLVYEQQFYLVMLLLMIPLLKRWRIELLLFSSIIIVPKIFGWISNRWVNGFLPAHWFEFLLGILLFLVINEKKHRTISIVILFFLMSVGFFGNYRTQAVSMFAILILLIFRYDQKLVNLKFLIPLKYLGAISYSLYLTHLISFLIIDTIFPSFQLGREPGPYILIILFSLFFGAGFYFFFEKPFINLSQQVS